MDMSRKILLAIFFVLSIISGVSCAADYPNPTGFVNDFAGVFSADQKNVLTEKIRDFEKRTSAEIAVVTVESLDGEDIKTYANNLFNKWGIGKKGKNNGILLLLAVKDRKIRIETGYGNEGILNDAKAGRVIKQKITPLFDVKKRKFAEGLIAGAEEVMTIIGQDIDASSNKVRADKDAAAKAAGVAAMPPTAAMANDSGVIWWIIGVIAVLGVLAGMGFIVISIRRNRENLKSLRSSIENKKNAFVEIELEYSGIVRAINALKLSSPRQILKYSLQNTDDVTRYISNTKSSLEDFHKILLKKFFASDDLLESSERLRKDILSVKGQVHNLASELHDYDRKKDLARKMMEYMPELIKKAENDVSDADVPAVFKEKLTQVKNSLGDVVGIAKKESIDWMQTHEKLMSAKDEIESISQNAVARKNEIAQARSRSAELINSLPGLIKKAELELNHADVSAVRTEDLKKGKDFYDRGKSSAYNGGEWLLILPVLLQASDLIDGAIKGAKKDKAEAEKARVEGPKLLAAFPALIQDAESKLQNFDSKYTGNAKSMFDKAKQKYAEASSLKAKNWLGVMAAILAAESLLVNALSDAQNQKDTEEAEKEKQRRRKREKEEAERRRRREEEEEEERRRDRDSGVSLIGLGSGSSGSNNDDGPSFGGGSSGGGGADDSF